LQRILVSKGDIAIVGGSSGKTLPGLFKDRQFLSQREIGRAGFDVAVVADLKSETAAKA